jgi:hypothetical protein
MVTCSLVYELAKGDFQYLPDDTDQRTDQAGKLPVLAMYPITFGLPEGDKEWKKMIDGALKSLMKEAAGVLVSLYKTYLDSDKDNRFKDSLLDLEDKSVTSEPLREMFRDLFKAHGLMGKPAAAIGMDPQQ